MDRGWKRLALDMLLPPVKKPAKTTGLKMGQGKFWAHFRRGDSQYFSEPEEDCSSVVSGCGGAIHRPPVTGVLSWSLGRWSLRNRSAWITPTEREPFLNATVCLEGSTH